MKFLTNRPCRRLRSLIQRTRSPLSADVVLPLERATKVAVKIIKSLSNYCNEHFIARYCDASNCKSYFRPRSKGFAREPTCPQCFFNDGSSPLEKTLVRTLVKERERENRKYVHRGIFFQFPPSRFFPNLHERDVRSARARVFAIELEISPDKLSMCENSQAR